MKPAILLKKKTSDLPKTVSRLEIPENQIKSAPNNPFNIYNIANNITISRQYLDKGAYGTVYLVTDLKTGQKCIVKEIIIPPTVVSRPKNILVIY